MADQRTFVIIGAGLAGAKAAETLREGGFGGRVLLLGAEPDRPYERPPLSKGILTGAAERSSAFVHDESWYAEHEVALRTATEVTAVDTASHEIHVGDERIGYDRLLLTTGSDVRPLSMDGVDAEGVRYLRTFGDLDRLDPAITDGSSVVLIGAGWIGLEVAAAARGRGAEVTIVEADRQPLRRVLGDEMGAVFADLHREHGVDVRLQAQITAIRPGRHGKPHDVVLADGSEIPADVLLAGVGVSPASALAVHAGIAVDPDSGAIEVDGAFHTSAEDVFAAGDVVSIDHPVLGTRVHVEHWANAYNGGPAAARSMLGELISWSDLPFFFSDQYDLGLEFAGYLTDPDAAQLVFRGDLAAREFVVFWLVEGRLAAGMNVNVFDVSDQIQAIIAAGKRVDAAALADESVPLASLAGA